MATSESFQIHVSGSVDAAGKVQITLPTPISLQTTFEIGLTQMTYSTGVYNIPNSQVKYFSENRGQPITVNLPAATYASLQNLVLSINSLFVATGDDSTYKISLLAGLRKVRLEITTAAEDDDCPRPAKRLRTMGEGETTPPFVQLSSELCALLGFDAEKMIATTVGPHCGDLNHFSRNILVTTNIIPNTNVGDTLRPLLATCAYQEGPAQNSVQFVHPSYHIVQTNYLSVLSFDLLNDYGMPFPFLHCGRVWLVLNFRVME